MNESVTIALSAFSTLSGIAKRASVRKEIALGGNEGVVCAFRCVIRNQTAAASSRYAFGRKNGAHRGVVGVNVSSIASLMVFRLERHKTHTVQNKNITVLDVVQNYREHKYCEWFEESA